MAYTSQKCKARWQMLTEALIVEAAAGTGKTQFSVEHNAENKDKKSLILTFSRKLARELRVRYVDLDDVVIRTAHSLGYWLLKLNNALPTVFQNLNPIRSRSLTKTFSDIQLLTDMDDILNSTGVDKAFDQLNVPDFTDIDEKTNELTSADFDCLIELPQKMSSEDALRYLDQFDMIYIDEYQDFHLGLINFLKFIFNLKDYMGVFLGDNMQKIQDFRGQRHTFAENNFVTIESDYGCTEIDYKYLLIDFRFEPNVRYLISEFVKLNFPDEVATHVYENTIDKKCFKNKHSLPFVYFCVDLNEILKRLNSIITDNPDKSVVVMYRWNKKERTLLASDEYRTLQIEHGVVVHSTIHKAKGSEFDIAILMDFNTDYTIKLDDKNRIKELRLAYVALTRGKSQLYILTRSSRESINTVIPEGTYISKGRQHSTVKPICIRKKIDFGANYTERKLGLGVIDSIVFSVSEDEAPIERYVAAAFFKQGKQKRENSVYIDYPGGQYLLARNHGTRHLYFRFIDLNLLHRNCFTDEQVVSLCFNAILKFFDNKINTSIITLQRIDLCKYFPIEDRNDRLRFYNAMWQLGRHLELSSLVEKVNKNKQVEFISMKDARSHAPGINSTLYLNIYSNRNRVITIYRPINKPENRINIPRLIKYEIRSKLPKNVSDSFRDIFPMTIIDLLAVLKKEKTANSLFKAINEYHLSKVKDQLPQELLLEWKDLADKYPPLSVIRDEL